MEFITTWYVKLWNVWHFVHYFVLEINISHFYLIYDINILNLFISYSVCVRIHFFEIKFGYLFPPKTLVFVTHSMSKKQKNKNGNITLVLYSNVLCYGTRSYQIMSKTTSSHHLFPLGGEVIKFQWIWLWWELRLTKERKQW